MFACTSASRAFSRLRASCANASAEKINNPKISESILDAIRWTPSRALLPDAGNCSLKHTEIVLFFFNLLKRIFLNFSRYGGHRALLALGASAFSFFTLYSGSVASLSSISTPSARRLSEANHTEESFLSPFLTCFRSPFSVSRKSCRPKSPFIMSS